jgi:cytochrome c peroxidase
MKKSWLLRMWMLSSVVFFAFSAFQQQLFPENIHLEDSLSMQMLRKAYSQNAASWPKATIDKGINFVELNQMPPLHEPEDNPSTPEKIALGKWLFFDPRLSASGQISCASCHNSELGWGDGLRSAVGHNRRVGKRNSMSLLNIGYLSKDFFWDGRAQTLEHQALFPIQDSLEMNASLPEVIQKLSAIAAYRSAFKLAFGSEEINASRMAQALASFQRSIKSRKNRFDLFVEGRHDALNDEELLGLHLFRTKARCANCHHSALFTDFKFHNDGFTMAGRGSEDPGYYAVTQKPEDYGRFRTPSLRDVIYTGPWMHTGTMASLPEIIQMYNLGMPQPIPKKAQNNSLLPVTSPHIQKLNLSEQEQKALLAFLNAISARPSLMSPPKLPDWY